MTELVYYFDFDENEVTRANVREIWGDKIWIDIDKYTSVQVFIGDIGFSKEEALNKHEYWKLKYKNDLLSNNKWIKELYDNWVCGSEMPRSIAEQEIMREVIKEKVLLDVDKIEIE